MPLFEFDARRQLEGSAAQPDAERRQESEGGDTDPARLAQVIEDNLDGLVGEHVFPVVRSFSPAEPYLIALDPSGAPVVVEVVAHLDVAALIRCLDHAGAAGRMTRGQLAGQYPGGADAFVADLSRFMDSVPVKRARLPRTGSRLIIICHKADDDVLNAVDFLRQPAMPVEVLRVNLVNGQSGRRFLDLSPLVINPDSAPDRPILLGTSQQRQIPGSQPSAAEQIAATQTGAEKIAAGSADPDRRARLTAAIAAAQQAVQRAEAVIALGVTAGDKAPETAKTPGPTGLETRRQRRERLAAERAAEVAALRAARTQAPRAATPDPVPSGALAALEDELATLRRPEGEQAADHLPTGLQTGQPLPRVLRADALPAGLTIDGVLAAGTDVSDPLSWDTAQLPVVVEPVTTGSMPRVGAPQSGPVPKSGPIPIRETVQRTPIAQAVIKSRWPQPLPHNPARRIGRVHPPLHRAAQSTAETLSGDDSQIDDRPDERLVALAGRLGKDTALVWERPRRRQRFVAKLDEFGTIHLGDGEVFHNPDAAARAAASSRTADGWNCWRLETPDGPTLREALDADLTQ